MTLVNLKDNEGYTYRLTDINLEYNIPCFSRAKEAALNFKEIEARHDDILLCGYPKAGTDR